MADGVREPDAGVVSPGRGSPPAPRMRWAAVACAFGVAIAAGGAWPDQAVAHENRRVHEGAVRVAPGEAALFAVELHYHRLVGHVRAGAPDAELVVRVTGPGGGAGDVVAGPGAALAVNALVACCKGTTWAPHEIAIENRGAGPADVDVRLVLVHDGIAVIGADAETGAAASTLAWFVLFGAVFGYRLRRRAEGTSGARRWARWAVAAHAGMWLVTGAMAAWGLARYGGGPVGAAIAAGADLPWLSNPILTTHDVVLGTAFILWIVSAGMWTAAARRAADARRIGVLGVALASGSLLACLIWAAEHGLVVMPVLVGLASAAVPGAGGAWLLVRVSRRAAAAPPGASGP